MDSGRIELPSGLGVVLDFESLRRMCHEEFAYYDAVADVEPNKITPGDVAITIAVNSWISNAADLREVHRGLARACDHLLPDIPIDADLLLFDQDLNLYHDLIEAACSHRGVQIARASKVLHRKRPGYIPMLDSVLINAYLEKRPALKNHAERAATFTCRKFREDLRAVEEGVVDLTDQLAKHGYTLTAVRVFEMLMWTQYEERGYYQLSGG